ALEPLLAGILRLGAKPIDLEQGGQYGARFRGWLEEIEQIGVLSQPLAQLLEALETAAGAVFLGCGGQRGRDSARRGPTNRTESIALRQLDHGLRIDDAARDPTFEDEIAVLEVLGLVGMGNPFQRAGH